MTRNDIISTYHKGPDAVVEAFTLLCDRIDELESRIQELEARFNKDSHNK